MSHRPVVRGLQVCQQVIVEESTKNYTLVNCFTRLEAERVPSHPFNFQLHALLGGGLGDIDVGVLIFRAADLSEIYQTSGRLRFLDRLSDYRLGMRITRLIFPAFGKYELGLTADGESLAQTYVTLVQRRQQP